MDLKLGVWIPFLQSKRTRRDIAPQQSPSFHSFQHEGFSFPDFFPFSDRFPFPWFHSLLLCLCLYFPRFPPLFPPFPVSHFCTISANEEDLGLWKGAWPGTGIQEFSRCLRFFLCSWWRGSFTSLRRWVVCFVFMLTSVFSLSPTLTSVLRSFVDCRISLPLAISLSNWMADLAACFPPRMDGESLVSMSSPP